MSFERTMDPSQDPERRPFSSSVRPALSPEEEVAAREDLRTRYRVLDSGQRKHFPSGMQRDVDDDKIQYGLAFDGPMLERYAIHLTKGARKYTSRNWMRATTKEEMERFKQSAIRHFMQWMKGDTEEDHAAAVFFNINGFEYVKEKIDVSDHSSGAQTP